MTRAMRDRLRRVAAGTPGRTKAKKPDAVRGKKTKKAKMEEIAKRLRRQRAMGPLPKAKGMSPGMKKAITGAATGMGGAGLLALARRIKPRGRLNADDMDRLKKLKKQTGGKMSKADFKAIFDKIAKDRVTSPPGKKPVLDSKGNPVKNLFQKDDRPKRGMQRQMRPMMPKIGRRPGIRKRKNVFKK